MAQVSNESEFAAALEGTDSSIQLTNDISVTRQWEVSRSVTVSSFSPGIFTLKKTPSCNQNMFLVTSGGSLRLFNIILDGNRTFRPDGSDCGQSLIRVNGGALYLETGCLLQNNYSAADGGGVYLQASSLPNTLIMNGSAQITGCAAAACGGGISIFSGTADDNISISDQAVVKGNTAEKGGGIYLTAASAPVSLRLSGVLFCENTAGTGGALCLLSDAGFCLTAENCTFCKNAAVSGAAGSGGAMWLQNRSVSHPSKLTLNGCRMEDNQASASGGALLLGTEAAVDFLSRSSSFTGNEAGNSGGALYCSGSGNIRFSCSLLSSNTAGCEGGALRLFSSGGALDTIVEDSIINGSAALYNGGGIWNGGAKATLRLTGRTIIENNSCRIGNGGGIYCRTKAGRLILDSKTAIRGNRAGETEGAPGGSGGGICGVSCRILIEAVTDISGNTALKNGGGISLSDSCALEMTGGRISSNTAEKKGGGLWNHGGSTAWLTGGDISLNTAGSGGGIYNDIGSQIYQLPPAALGLAGENRAVFHAPGIYNNGEFYTEGLIDIGNGLYIGDRDAVLFLQGGLDKDALIRLDNSGYISPNPDGSPVIVGEGSSPHCSLTEQDLSAFRKPFQDFDGWEMRLSGDSTQVCLLPAVYAIRYEALEGSTHSNPGSYTVVSPDIRLLPPSNRPGYRFSGWYDAPKGGRRVTVVPQGASGNLTFYARWTRRRPGGPHRPNKICSPAGPDCRSSYKNRP